jgi:hypothetical protein
MMLRRLVDISEVIPRCGRVLDLHVEVCVEVPQARQRSSPSSLELALQAEWERR